ncbi:MAG: 16S rRNA (guanine(527)-N(7))-methyltransferase RsmG [Clostridia bacterium]|nr:16S rRNA (guanine(527)-N(7))-methyltransferase RsmG [Clostridia bacterium]
MNRVKEFLQKNNIDNIDEKLFKLEKYMDRILELNNSINLTAIKDREEFVEKHYLDSLSIVISKEFQDAKKLIDVGTGAGFPGIPLAIVFPDKKFILMDSLQKRLKIIDTLCEELGIANVQTLHGRAEDIGQNPQYRESFDICLSRAVARLTVLSEYCIPLVKQEGYFISYKGAESEEEIGDARNSIGILGGKLINVIDANPGENTKDHNLILIKKIKNTPSNYPRKAGLPSKKPLN